MTTAAALHLLGLHPAATAEEIGRAYAQKRSDLSVGEAKAPTPGLKAKYAQQLADLDAAFAVAGRAAQREQNFPSLQPAELPAPPLPPPPVVETPVVPPPAPVPSVAAPAAGGKKAWILASVAVLATAAAAGWWLKSVNERREADRQHMAAESALAQQRAEHAEAKLRAAEEAQRADAAAIMEKDQLAALAAEEEKLRAAEEKQRVDAAALMEKERLAALAAEEQEKQRDSISSATKENPWTNSLGMKFVPVPGTDVLFCQHETRSKDYAAFMADRNRGYEMTGNNADDWRTCEYWTYGDKQRVPVGRGAGEEAEQSSHPVQNVSWDDAVAFCEWLSRKEGKTYRLPTDREWSVAVGIPQEPAGTPQELGSGMQGVYPWGGMFVASAISGNYSDSAAGAKFGKEWSIIAGYRDGFATTAPVMSFAANSQGLYDMGGNLDEWMAGGYMGTDPQGKNKSLRAERAVRGGSWISSGDTDCLSSKRVISASYNRWHWLGFRCVVVAGSGDTSTNKVIGLTPSTSAAGAKNEMKTTASGLKYEVLKQGTGTVSPKTTDTVKVHYHGTLLDGTVFDSSVQRGEPVSFPVARVIKGWTEGLQLMKVGDTFKFEMPSELAYGDQGVEPAIPPRSTLVFEVELLGIE